MEALRSAVRGHKVPAAAATAFAFALAVALVFALMAAPVSEANNEHPDAPCWSNGFGDGTNSNGNVHPYIHFTYNYGSCGTYQSAMAVSAWNCNSGCYRAQLKNCGVTFNCHFDWPYAGGAECGWRAGIDAPYAPSNIPHHWHYHHYQCV